jgi:hypothetical protein
MLGGYSPVTPLLDIVLVPARQDGESEIRFEGDDASRPGCHRYSAVTGNVRP